MHDYGVYFGNLIDAEARKHLDRMRSEIKQLVSSKMDKSQAGAPRIRSEIIQSDSYVKKVTSLNIADMDLIAKTWVESCINLSEMRKMWDNDIGYPHVFDDNEEEFEDFVERAQVVLADFDFNRPGQWMVFSFAIYALLRVLQRAGLDEFVRR